ncbi:MAG: squalene/phytoene synthase family protein [Bacteroidales bacterium]|nr:squalene/phytoene synthase family protein [Bacteroidales bacterium]
MDLFNDTTFCISKKITQKYSTSFFWASNFFENEIKKHIFSIYGFVRFADEIVDTFHNYDKKKLLLKFEDDLKLAIEDRISLNPVLNSFQNTYYKYNIKREYVNSFLLSMKMDLEKKNYNTKQEIDEYIYGSADVVGLMCLQVFCKNDFDKFEQLKHSALKLGSAFQKVNFLRDLKDDMQKLDRKYFWQISVTELNEESKKAIIDDIKNDFKIAYIGIKKLPKSARTAVLIAYFYYLKLLKKIDKTKIDKMLKKRISVSNFIKVLLILKSFFVSKMVFKNS